MAGSDQASAVQVVVSAVQGSSKYRYVAEDVIAHIAARELANRRNTKEAIKATKNKLHQVGAAYMPQRATYDRWLAELRQAAGDEAALRERCAEIMRQHASTQERLPILGELYGEVSRRIGAIHSVMDVACGFNPLAIPWMSLAPDAVYYAYDMYLDLAEFLQGFIALVGVRGEARAIDVSQGVPQQEVQVAYLLKAIPCLEQLDKAVGLRLLESIPARHLLVSFPVASLGGTDKGMLDYYAAHFAELVQDRQWRVEQLVFATELVYLVHKDQARP
jgi:16S rRNA (guanine(1405)-N(7))-methyltransferase